MSLPDYSIAPKIIDSAKKEFLAKGYADASLREICKNAGVTTGALYKRYPNKESLLSALVEPALKDLLEFSNEIEHTDYEFLGENRAQAIWNTQEEKLKGYMNFIYDRYDSFRILLCRADGSPYGNFLHDFVEEHTKKTLTFVWAVSSSPTIDETELHMLQTAFWATLVEPVIHDLPREKALLHCSYVAKFFNWSAVLNF